MQPNDLTWARKRQIIIVSGLSILFITLLTIGLYVLLHKPATCFDNKQNQDETGIDCGGSICSRICQADSKGLSVQWVRLFKIRDGVYSVVARVENPAINSIATNVPYTFNLKDANGTIVATRSGSTFIPSHSSFIVFEGTIETKGMPETVAFQFDKTPDFQKSDYVQPDVVILNKELINQDSQPRLTASVKNPNVTDVKNLTLSALIYDDEGNAVQVSRTHVDVIKPGETVNAVFTWPNPISLKSRVCVTPVDTSLVIDRSGSMQFLGDNPPQPLTDVKNAASYFISELSKKDRASIVSFANEASNPIDSPLSSNIDSITAAVNAISITQPWSTQNTNVGDGMLKGSESLTSSPSNSGKVMVVLTDGVATRPVKVGVKNYAESYALTVAADAKAKGIRIFTIGLGKDLNQDFLKKVASAPTDFYLAPNASDLAGIYHQIGTAMCKRMPTALEIVPSIPLSN